MSFGDWTDPHLLPCRRNDERSDPLKPVPITHRTAMDADVTECPSGSHPANSRPAIALRRFRWIRGAPACAATNTTGLLGRPITARDAFEGPNSESSVSVSTRRPLLPFSVKIARAFFAGVS